MNRENNIDLGLNLNTGMNEKTQHRYTEEEKSIARERGRDIDKKIKNDSVVTGIANFRLLSKQ